MPEVAFQNPASNMLVTQWHVPECRIRTLSFELPVFSFISRFFPSCEASQRSITLSSTAKRVTFTIICYLGSGPPSLDQNRLVVFGSAALQLTVASNLLSSH